MKKNKTLYTWSDDPHTSLWFQDCFNSIEECLKDAAKCGRPAGTPIYIGICEPYKPFLDAEKCLETAADDAYETVGEAAEDWLEYNRGEGYTGADKLQKMLDEVFKKWLEETHQQPNFFHVSPIEGTFVTPKLEEPSKTDFERE
jgi:hypothetical protein